MGETASEIANGVLPAENGVGPLYQRDYWARIRNPRLSPPEIVEVVRRHFPSFAPAELAAFDAGRALEHGDELRIRIAGAGEARVRAVHLDAQSFTLATLEGHPEAGRITFGAYRGGKGELYFHIRSRARSESALRLLGFMVAGEAMQTNTWSQFVSRVAALAGDGVEGFVHAKMEEAEDEDDDFATPTFQARGG